MSTFLSEIRPGDKLRINGVLQNVIHMNAYRERHEGETHWWYELELRGDDGIVCTLEWDDKCEDFFLYGISIELEELGLDSSDLDKFDEDEEGTFVSSGIIYHYADSGEALYFEGSAPGEPVQDKKGVTFYYWDFMDDTGDYSTTVEEWSTGYETFVGMRIDHAAIEKA